MFCSALYDHALTFQSITQVHLFQARKLPALDSNASLDPYVVLHFGGQTQRSNTVDCSTTPRWYHTFTFTDSIYVWDEEERRRPAFEGDDEGSHWHHAFAYCPQLRLEVWDADSFSSDDFVGQVVLLNYLIHA